MFKDEDEDLEADVEKAAKEKRARGKLSTWNKRLCIYDMLL